MNATERLQHLAQRVASDPTFLSHALARYQQAHALDDAALASWLGLDDPNNLAPLALCRMPHADHYATDIARIAHHLGANPERLAALLAEGEVSHA